jgi:hypothetical protein
MNDFPISDPGTARTIISGNMSRLADLTLRLPSAVTSGNSTAQGADVYNGLVERVSIDASGASFGAGANDGSAAAMLIRGGEIRHLDVSLGLDTDALGVRVSGNGGNAVDLEDVTTTSPTALYSDPEASPTPITVTGRRVVLHSPSPLTVLDGFLELSDSVIDASSAPLGSATDFSVGAAVYDGRAPDPAGMTFDRVTFVGNGDPYGAALSVAGQGSSPPTFIRARHILTSGFARTLAYQYYGSDPAATIDYSNVDTGPAAIVDTGPPGGTLTADFATGNRAGDPLLDDALGLRLSSPAIDIGGPDLLPGGPLDLAGTPRPADGDGDGSVLNDAGAYEPTPAPTSASTPPTAPR